MTRSLEILLTGGIGDVLAVESLMSEEERLSLKTIYWATTIASIGVDLFKASTRYRDVEHIVYPVTQTFFEAEGVRKVFPLPETVQDWSISIRFREFDRRRFTFSTFLVEPAAYIHHLPIPNPFVLIQHETPFNDADSQAIRNLDLIEWGLIHRRLEELGLHAVVVNSKDASPAPKHPRVIDLTGKTSYRESLALLRASVGYWGIASSICVAASQVFEPEYLWIKGPEAWLRLNRYIYFAPQITFDYVFSHLSDENPIATLYTDMVTLKMTCTRIVRGELVGPGSLITVTPKEAEVWIRTGQATKVDVGLLRESVLQPLKKVATRFKAVK